MKKKTVGFFEDFKSFISKGNVLDLAVGVVMGGAFGKIVASLVDNIIMPLTGALLGGVDFTDAMFTVKGVKVQYGMFIQNVVDFLIIAASIFVVLSLIEKLNIEDEEEPDVKPEKSIEEKQLELLKEISKKIDK